MAEITPTPYPHPVFKAVTVAATPEELEAVAAAASKAIERGYWCAEIGDLEVCFRRKKPDKKKGE